MSDYYGLEENGELNKEELEYLSRLARVQSKRIAVDFEIPTPVAKMLGEDGFPSFHAAMRWSLDVSGKKDYVAVSRSIPFPEIVALKELIVGLDDEEVKRASRGLLKQLTSVIELIVNGKKRKIGYLRNLPAAIFAFLEDGYIDGWLYRMDSDGNVLPYLVTEVVYRNPRDPDSKPFVRMETMGYAFGERKVSTHTFTANEISGRTVSELLYSECDFLHETEDMKKQYIEAIGLYNKYVKMENHQFRIRGVGMSAGRWGGYNSENITENAVYAKAVNDEANRKRHAINLEADNRFWIANFDADENSYCSVPVHPFVYIFHLGKHKHMWVASKNMTVYEYDKQLGDKLVLPESHKELVNILTSDSDILMEDIIEGKGAGTIILCKGIPGVGKTLTAQVYAEVMERPLYNVNAGQLGTSIKEVEETLQLVMERAERWGAVLLIDEADIYIRTRGNDVHHNALVAVWLRTIEYFNGLMFLTTNRGDDVDDAIESRCIATIAYDKPDAKGAAEIWRIMTESAGIFLSQSDIYKLVNTFPDAVGRDIEKLVRLTARFVSKKGIEPDVEAFVHCAAFRGMVSKE